MIVQAVQDQISQDEITRLFKAQKSHQYAVANAPVGMRKQKLRALKEAILVTYREEIRAALHTDMGKSQIEADLIEIYPVVKEIKHALAHLNRWTGKHFVPTPIAFFGSRSYVEYEPKGVCLLLSPWNFPLSLTLGPLVGAIAAGNTVVIKPSEFTPNTSHLVAKIIDNLFDEREVTVVEGAVDTATQLLELPFNHIFFTGSPQVGKIVMQAAAKNLTSVTLELGGKSPTIVDETADIDTAARRTVWGKWINSGQICIAPDYVFVHESKMEAFSEALLRYIRKFFGEDATQSPDYSRMVNGRHLDRVKDYLDDSVEHGATVIYGGRIDKSANSMGPTVVKNVKPETSLMKNEIFGPVLPLLSYSDIGKVLQRINAGEKPLALYLFSTDNRKIRHIRKNTRAGTSCINHSGIQYFQPYLPFGGSNHSGIGKAHGFYSFQAFSNARSYYRQYIPNALELLTPPYRKWKEQLVEWTVKYF